tara:strand:+ start:375 stop:554 length:180 start_codon:yes stop_codon:yes gene_type:complete
MKTRYREQKRFLRESILVLQVAFEVDETWNDDIQPSLRGVHTLWRDATATDLVLEEGKL